MNLSKGEKTSIRIIEVATELFYKHGFYNVTFKQIAAELGLTQPALYKHFDDLEDLVIEASRHWVIEAQLAIDSKSHRAISAKDKLKSTIESNFKYSFENRSKDGLLFALSYLSLSSEKAHAFYSGIATAGVARVLELVELGTDGGEWGPEWSTAHSRSVAVSIHSLMVGEISKMIVMPDEASASARAKRCWRDACKLLEI